jgi:hypothetical protein
MIGAHYDVLHTLNILLAQYFTDVFPFDAPITRRFAQGGTSCPHGTQWLQVYVSNQKQFSF